MSDPSPAPAPPSSLVTLADARAIAQLGREQANLRRLMSNYIENADERDKAAAERAVQSDAKLDALTNAVNANTAQTAKLGDSLAQMVEQLSAINHSNAAKVVLERERLQYDIQASDRMKGHVATIGTVLGILAAAISAIYKLFTGAAPPQ